MKWTLFLIPFIAIILYSVIRRFRLEKSNRKIVDNYKVIDVADFTIHWFYFIFGLLFILLFILSDDPNKKMMFFIISIVYIIQAFYDIVLQKLIHVNRLAYNDKELLFLGRRNTSIPLNEIQSISLNGISNQIVIEGKKNNARFEMSKLNRKIKFNYSVFTSDNFRRFILFVDNAVELKNIKVSNNIKKILNLEVND